MDQLPATPCRRGSRTSRQLEDADDHARRRRWSTSSPRSMATSWCSASAARWARRSPGSPSARRRDKRVVGVARFSEAGAAGEARGSSASRPSPAICSTATPSLRLPKLAERDLHGRAQVRHRRAAGADLGDERPGAGDRRRDLPRRRGSSPSRPAASIPTSRSARRGRPRRRRPWRRPASTPTPASAASACFEYFSRRHGTPGRLIRLNYAIDLRYGVLHDVARKVLQGTADRPHDGPRQRHLAGRRQRHGAARARPLHDADQPAQRQRPRDRQHPLAGGGLRRAPRPRAGAPAAARLRPPGSPTRPARWRCSAILRCRSAA